MSEIRIKSKNLLRAGFYEYGGLNKSKPQRLIYLNACFWHYLRRIRNIRVHGLNRISVALWKEITLLGWALRFQRPTPSGVSLCLWIKMSQLLLCLHTAIILTHEDNELQASFQLNAISSKIFPFLWCFLTIVDWWLMTRLTMLFVDENADFRTSN